MPGVKPVRIFPGNLSRSHALQAEVFYFPIETSIEDRCHWRRVLMILETRCHGIRPWNRITVWVQSEMLSSSCRSGGFFFIAHAWRLNVCLWVTTLVVDAGKKLPIFFFRPGWKWCGDETASPVGHAALQTEAPAYQDTVLTQHKGSEEILPIFHSTFFKENNWLLF